MLVVHASTLNKTYLLFIYLFIGNGIPSIKQMILIREYF